MKNWKHFTAPNPRPLFVQRIGNILMTQYGIEKPPSRFRSNHCSWNRSGHDDRSYFGLRGKGMNPFRFGILTLGSDCASSASLAPMISLRWRM